MIRELLLALLDEAYDHKAWHGPNLRGAIRRVDARHAAWRPGAGRHSIAEITLHAAYWKYVARRRLRGDKRGSFTLKGSNWFLVAAGLTDAEWRRHVVILDEEHRLLRTAVESLPKRRFEDVPKGSRISQGRLIYSIAMHDVYHAGQIQTLKALQKRGG